MKLWKCKVLYITYPDKKESYKYLKKEDMETDPFIARQFPATIVRQMYSADLVFYRNIHNNLQVVKDRFGYLTRLELPHTEENVKNPALTKLTQ